MRPFCLLATAMAVLLAVPIAWAACAPDCTGSSSVSCLYCSEECGVCSETGAVDRCVQPGTVHMSVDDGPRGTTPLVLDVLRHYNVSATFFVIGNLIAGREAMLHRMALEGHRVADHTWAHPNLNALNDTTQMRDELVRSRDEIRTALALLTANTTAYPPGEPFPTLHAGGTNPRDPVSGEWVIPEYRPPYGELNRIVRGVVDSERYLTVLWNMDTFDWSHNVSVIADAVDTTLATFDPATNSFIVLMHLTERVGVCTLPAVIERFQARGYVFVSADECWGARAHDVSAPPLNPAVAAWRQTREFLGLASRLCQPPTMQAQSYDCNENITCYSPSACCAIDGSCGSTEWQCGEGCVSGACAECVPNFFPPPLLPVEPLEWPDQTTCPSVPMDDLPHLRGEGNGGGKTDDDDDDAESGSAANATTGIVVGACATGVLVLIALAARDRRVAAKCEACCKRSSPPPAAAPAPSTATRAGSTASTTEASAKPAAGGSSAESISKPASPLASVAATSSESTAVSAVQLTVPPAQRTVHT